MFNLFRKKQILGRFDYFFSSSEQVYVSDLLPIELGHQCPFLETQLFFSSLGMYFLMSRLPRNKIRAFALTVSAQLSAMGSKKRIKGELNIPLKGLFFQRSITALKQRPEPHEFMGLIFMRRGQRWEILFDTTIDSPDYFRAALDAFLEHQRVKLSEHGDLVVACVASVIHVIHNHEQEFGKAVPLLKQMARDLSHLRPYEGNS